jgi:hypothetical protein
MGATSIAIGFQAGQTNMSTNAIILNATGPALNSTNPGLYIKPIRQDITRNYFPLCYNTTSFELAYFPTNLMFIRTVVNAATYTVLLTDTLIGVTYTPTGTVTITLPSASTYINRVLNVVDEGGNARNKNITINRAGADTIVGATSYVVNKNYESVTLYSNGGTGWFVL